MYHPVDPSFSNLQTDQEVLLTHGDSCTKAAPGTKIIAKNGEKIVGQFDTSLEEFLSHNAFLSLPYH